MTISTDAFDLIFSRRNKTELRIDRIEARIERAQSKLDNLLDDPITNVQQRRVGRLEGLIASRSSRRDQLVDDLGELNSVVLPGDDIVINYNSDRDSTTFGVSLQESPYEDLFDAGEYVRVGVRGRQGNRTFNTTELALNNPEYKGDKYVLGDSSFSISGLPIRDALTYDSAEIYVNIGGTDVQTLPLV